MNFRFMLRDAIKTGNHDLVKSITISAMEYYTREILDKINGAPQADGVFISAALITLNTAIEASIGEDGKEARDALLKCISTVTIDIGNLIGDEDE